ncbi:MAG: prepilin-type N-terminal cleavage/methylation domain-containing protein [Planctomycetota bacterium]|nr:prepilin-type N-terminal cleavage/methylation domain-containing protein [Planctomycetota bacterium]
MREKFSLGMTGQNRNRSGFTLVELLVVMAIISLLAAMLLVALDEAREFAYRAQCTNNLRQVATACIHYANDNSEWFPQNSCYGSPHGNDGLCNNQFNGGANDFFPKYIQDPTMFSCNGRYCSTRGAKWMKAYSRGWEYRTRSISDWQADPNRDKFGGGIEVGNLGYFYWAYTGISGHHAHGLRRSGMGSDTMRCDESAAATRYPLISDAVAQQGPGPAMGAPWLVNHYKRNRTIAGGNMAYGDSRVKWYEFSAMHTDGGLWNWAPAYHGHE